MTRQLQAVPSGRPHHCNSVIDCSTAFHWWAVCFRFVALQTADTGPTGAGSKGFACETRDCRAFSVGVDRSDLVVVRSDCVIRKLLFLGPYLIKLKKGATFPRGECAAAASLLLLLLSSAVGAC